MPVQRIIDFDSWREGFAGIEVAVLVAGGSTLAPVFHDEALTEVAGNPQILASLAIGGRTFGKFSRPLYTASPYYIDAGALNQSGVQRPGLTSLVGALATQALAVATGGAMSRTLADHLSQIIYAKNHGEIGSTPATNNATITNAIGAASSVGGGIVVLPAGDVPFNVLTLPDSVRLAGQGRGVTVLQSQEQDNVITLGGPRAGLQNLTLDGISVQAGSVGVHGIGVAQPFANDAEVKRFATGLEFKGCTEAQFLDLHVNVCGTNVKLHGDTDAGGGGLGGPVANNRWVGGSIGFATDLGLDLSYEDAEVLNNAFIDLALVDNATAVRINGARFTKFGSIWMANNTKNFEILDDAAVGDVKNKVHGLIVQGHIDGGQIDVRDTAQDIVFERCELEGVEFALTIPKNPIVLRDCIEDTAVTITGDGTKLLRWSSIAEGTVVGVTTGAVAAEAWSVELDPGEMMTMRAMCTANRRDGEGRGGFIVEAVAHRPGSTLGYGAQTGNFTVGQILTGGTSGATGRIVADADSGVTGTLTLRSIAGEYLNGEALTDPLGGAATAVGALVEQNAVVGAQVKDIDYDPGTTTLDAVFGVAAGEVRLNVTGVAAQIFDWNCSVAVVRGG
jgi:hypothetical protein